ncbi:MAG TPA: hypothetical protein DCR93_02865, partial [Cytophagales bacterium]|nr:hypothetical protein [Cytophagales bacterium]
MSFYQPQFLWGLLALAIPILVHLFYFRRVRKVYFSNLQFLRLVKESKKQQLKLKHYLILASRLLAIFFLVMIFAQPYQPTEEEIALGDEVWVYLDNSPSMSTLVPDGFAGFDQGVAAVNNLLDLYPKGTQYRLMTNSFDAGSQVSRSQNEVRELLTEMSVGSRIRTFPEVINRFEATTTDPGMRPDVYFISDFQASVFEEEDPITLDSAWQVYLLPITYGQADNVLIDSVYLASPYLQPNEPNSLEVVLRNAGDAPQEDRLVKLFVNGVQVGNSSINISAQGTGSVSFPVNFPLQAENRCRISIEEFPVVFDNDFYFTLTLAGRIRIVEVKPDETITSVEKVYGNPTLFDFTSFSVSNVNYNTLEEADLVVLSGLNSWDAALQGTLTRYQQQGGTLAVFPGDTPDAGVYASSAGLSVIPAPQGPEVSLSGPDANSSFFQNIFTEADAQVDMPQVIPTLTWQPRTLPLLSLRTGAPFMSAIQGSGTTYLFAAPLSPDFGAFTQHAIFVPVMYRMAVLSKRVERPLFYRLNRTTFSFPVDSVSPEQLYKLR